MKYYYITTETQADRTFYDANKWSETQSGTTPTSGTPAKTDEFVIGESAENFVGTSESPVTFSFASSNSLPKSLVIFGYVSFTGGGGDTVSLRTLTVSFGSVTFDAVISPSLGGGNLTVTVAEHCALSLLSLLYWTNRPITFDLAATASVTIGAYTVLLTSVGNEIVLPNANITNTLKIFCRGTYNTFDVSGQISPGLQTIINNVELYNFTTVTSAAITTSEPLEISGNFTTSRYGTACTLNGQIDLKLIGTNNQSVNLTSEFDVAETFLMNVELAKASGTVAFNGVTANVNGYCGTDTNSNLIDGQNAAASKVTVAATSDITFNDTTKLTYLNNIGTVKTNVSSIFYKVDLIGTLNILSGISVRVYESNRAAGSALLGGGAYVLTWGVVEISELGTVSGVSIIDDAATVPAVSAITRTNEEESQTISWPAAVNDYGTATRYDIAVTTCNNAGSETTAAIYDQETLTYTNNNLASGSTYGYSVRVVSRGNVGTWTSAPLQVPTISAEAIVDGRIDVTIKPVALALLYLLDYSTDQDFADSETETFATFGTKQISDLRSGVTYYFRAKVFGEDQSPGFSETVTVVAAVDYYRVTRGHITINTDSTTNQGQTVACAARIVNLANEQPIRPQAVEGVTYTIYQSVERYGVVKRSIVANQQDIAADVDETIFDAIDLDSPFWTVDNGGCNFVLIPDIRTNPAFSEPGNYSVVATLKLTAGNPVVVQFDVDVE